MCPTVYIPASLPAIISASLSADEHCFLFIYIKFAHGIQHPFQVGFEFVQTITCDRIIEDVFYLQKFQGYIYTPLKFSGNNCELITFIFGMFKQIADFMILYDKTFMFVRPSFKMQLNRIIDIITHEMLLDDFRLDRAEHVVDFVVTVLFAVISFEDGLESIERIRQRISKRPVKIED